MSLLAFASTPLLAQTGIDLLDPEQIRRGMQSDEATTVRATLAEVPTGVIQATHETDTLSYDDNGFENFEDDSALEPTTNFTGTGMVEWAQRFEVPADSAVVSARVCFYRPENDPSRSLDFNLRFYSDQLDGTVRNPGRRSALTYVVESDLRRPGDDTCVLLRGHLVGKTLSRGVHWVAVVWDARTRKRLGGDHYTIDDQAEVDRSGNLQHETEVRYRDLPVHENRPNEGWTDPRTRTVPSPSSGLKAIGIRLVVERTHAPDPGPGPGPGPDPGPAPDSACSDGLCLLENDRFKVRARYAMPGMPGQAAGTVAAGLGGAAGLFTFGGDHPELLVRLVDDCSGSGYFKLYTGAATDADYSLAVRDTMTNELKWFRGLGGTSIRGTLAFTCNN
jgi:hypothetical protein